MPNTRRVRLHIEDAAETKIDKFLEKGHNQRVQKIKDGEFIEPVVITVKRNKTVKKALDAK